MSEPRQLDQGQRVPPGLPHQPVPDVVGDRHTGAVGEQRRRGVRGNAAHHQLGQVAALETADVTVAGREQQRNPFRSEPAGNEKQCGGGCLVQPVGIVHDAEHRRLLGGLRQQAQRGQEDQEPVTRRGVGFPERGPQRHRLPHREVFDVPDDRAQQPLQRGERQWEFRFDALGPQDLHAGLAIRSSPVHQVGQQRRLPDTRLPADHQRTTPGAASLGQQHQQAFLLPFSTV